MGQLVQKGFLREVSWVSTSWGIGLEEEEEEGGTSDEGNSTRGMADGLE